MTQSTATGRRTKGGNLYYQLTAEELLKVRKELKPAERDILLYLRCLNPFGDRTLDLGVRDLAATLDMVPSTVSRALRVLVEKGWIVLEMLTVRARILPLPRGNSVVSRQQEGSPGNTDDQETTTEIVTQHLEAITQLEQGFQSPTDYTNFKRPNNSVLEEVCKNGDSQEALTGNDFETPQGSSQAKNAVGLSKANSAIEDLPSAPPNSTAELTPPLTPLLQKAEGLGADLKDRDLQRVIRQYPERLENAIAALAEKTPKVKWPTRFLQKALEEDWQPEKSAAPGGWREWFDEARRRRLIIAGQRQQGQIMVLMIDNRWVPYNQLRLLSWAEMEAQLKTSAGAQPQGESSHANE